ncbi:diaminobutyrate acetyltransferase [Celerinatantimonas diazotrophica]|uniref:L-2,4-diaminobutyric acid acetyltransferase n=1 Tax=Celerinatantimonas diazotrophica TaxID=412034 RepID=A0A4R1JLJ7_9GAMM|nr:diaminobutyrate acetyltransferase [Celerinatantimonas diazotrophica]TCK51867.1 diaminobutyrate acetyltransferase [Celerinatantimonas diazotrophica]CAG9296440.1 L-2,4-diaminobutyric acid acetyltransferase [Celerinatantimonas diazotrophica]
MLDDVVFKKPTMADGYAVNQLIKNSPPLDTNSSYCNLLQCSHFADTSIGAYHAEQLVGFISGYNLPQQPNTLFIWQVAVSQKMRSQQIAKRMLHALIAQVKPVFIHTTITQDNAPSRALFASFAKANNTMMNEQPYMDKDHHFNQEHPSEALIVIGPLN